MTLLRKASRKKAKIRLGLSGISGGGKTYSALQIAYGMTGNWSKIAIIDSENGSADLYSHLGEYNVISLNAPFTPESYIYAIKECENEKIEVIIIDSITHEWNGKGGCLEIHEKETQADRMKNSFTAWAKVTPRHQSFIDSILQSKCHIITTVRTKTDFVMVERNGKQVPQKVGLSQVTRDGFEYELTISLDINDRHEVFASKDRTGLFIGKQSFIPNIETGKVILEWCETGDEVRNEVRNEVKEAIFNITKCNTIEELKELKIALPKWVITDSSFLEEAIARFNEISSNIDA